MSKSNNGLVTTTLKRAREVSKEILSWTKVLPARRVQLFITSKIGTKKRDSAEGFFINWCYGEHEIFETEAEVIKFFEKQHSDSWCFPPTSEHYYNMYNQGYSSFDIYKDFMDIYEPSDTVVYVPTDFFSRHTEVKKHMDAYMPEGILTE